MRILSFILALSMVFCLFAGCAKAKSEEKRETEIISVDYDPDFVDGMILELHLYSLCAYFTSDYTRGDSADLLHAAAEFLYFQRPDTVTFAEGSDTTFTVSDSQLESTIKLLFGEDLSLKDYRNYFSDEMGDVRNTEDRTYTFTYNSEIWNAKGLMPSFDTLPTEDETDTGMVASVIATDASGNNVTVTFSFTKTISDKYLYFTLDSVKVK